VRLMAHGAASLYRSATRHDDAAADRRPVVASSPRPI
jgi:hypothetical protein